MHRQKKKEKEKKQREKILSFKNCNAWMGIISKISLPENVEQSFLSSGNKVYLICTSHIPSPQILQNPTETPNTSHLVIVITLAYTYSQGKATCQSNDHGVQLLTLVCHVVGPVFKNCPLWELCTLPFFLFSTLPFSFGR